MAYSSGSMPTKRSPWKIVLRVLFFGGASYLAVRRWTQWHAGDSTALLSLVLWVVVALIQLLQIAFPDLLSKPDKSE